MHDTEIGDEKSYEESPLETTDGNIQIDTDLPTDTTTTSMPNR